MAARGVHNPAITWLPHVRVAWGGTLGNQGEIWTNALRYLQAGNQVITVEEAASAGPGVWAALVEWMGGGANGRSDITNQATLTWLKINGVLASGLQQNGDTNFYAGTPTSGAITSTVPLYQTAAVTLRTGVKRGRAHAGRIFPPCVSQQAATDINGRFSLADATGQASSFAGCMQAMQLAIRTAYAVGGFAVFSPGNTTTGKQALANLITTVEVDTVPDVQHRRENKLVRQIGTIATIAG